MSSIHLHAHAHADLTPRLEEVSPGVYAYVQPDGSWGLNNPGFLVGRDGVTAVDTCFTEARARAFRAAVARVTDRPVRTLINTHSHGDHTFGNFLFPEATIIGHERCRSAILASELDSQPFFPGVDWGNIEVAPPFVTFEERLSVYVDDLKLELRFVGPAHTDNDLVVWAPERRLLFAGDLIFAGCTPFVVMGSVAGALQALEFLRGLGPELIIPGHGNPCGPEAIQDAIAYLRFVQETARKAFEAGLAPLEAARATDLGRFAGWPESERLVANLHRAYAEIRGEPLGAPLAIGSVFREMIALNGGRPLRCLA
jgi:cyclase